jgi:hypothetical protein
MNEVCLVRHTWPKRLMYPRPVIVSHPPRKNCAQVLLRHRNHPVKTCAAYGADHAVAKLSSPEDSQPSDSTREIIAHHDNFSDSLSKQLVPFRSAGILTRRPWTAASFYALPKAFSTSSAFLALARLARISNRSLASWLASAIVASSSISLFTLILRASANAFSRSCLSSGRRIVRVDMNRPPSIAPVSGYVTQESAIHPALDHVCSESRLPKCFRRSLVLPSGCRIHPAGWGARRKTPPPNDKPSRSRRIPLPGRGRTQVLRSIALRATTHPRTLQTAPPPSTAGNSLRGKLQNATRCTASPQQRAHKYVRIDD